MWLQLLFSTADIVSWISTEMGSDLELTTLWCQCHILMPFCHTLCVCQEFNFQMYMRTHKLLTFSRPHFEFISKRTEISSTFPIQFYLTLVSQIEMSPSNWLFEFSLQTNERARYHQRTAPLTCHRHTEQKMWWAILWGDSVCGWDPERAGKPLHTRYFQFFLMTSILDIQPHLSSQPGAQRCIIHEDICQGSLLPIHVCASLPSLSILDLAPDQPSWPCFRITECFGLEGS